MGKYVNQQLIMGPIGCMQHTPAEVLFDGEAAAAADLDGPRAHVTRCGLLPWRAGHANDLAA